MSRPVVDRLLDGSHSHHFRIEPPSGPTSIGRCSCGESRTFQNELVPTYRRPKTPVLEDAPTPEALAAIERETEPERRHLSAEHRQKIADAIRRKWSTKREQAQAG